MTAILAANATQTLAATAFAPLPTFLSRLVLQYYKGLEKLGKGSIPGKSQFKASSKGLYYCNTTQGR
jgi:hypothetical protein